MSLVQNLSILLIENILGPMSHLFRGYAQTSRLELLELCIYLLHIVETYLHADIALNIGLLGLILALYHKSVDESDKLSGQYLDNLV